MEVARRVAGYSLEVLIYSEEQWVEKPEEMAKQREFLLTVQKRRIIFQKKKLMKFLVFWKICRTKL